MNEPMDRALADWLRDGPDQGPREGLERALAATRQVSQRPAWAIPERWLPMQLTMQRAPQMRPVLLLATMALLILALVAAAILVGSPRRLPEPFGIARNGAIVFERDGDLFIADDLLGTSRTLTAGSDRDLAPSFSNQGDRIAFIRDVDEGIQLMSVRPDGSDLRTLGTFPNFDGFRWSPDGGSLLINYTATDITAFRLAVVVGAGAAGEEGEAVAEGDLDLRGFEIARLDVDGRPASFLRDGQELVITPARPLKSGDPFTVAVDYAGKPEVVTDPDGSVEGWVPTADGAFVVNEPQGSPGWYPANDNPRDKATFDFAVG